MMKVLHTIDDDGCFSLHKENREVCVSGGGDDSATIAITRFSSHTGEALSSCWFSFSPGEIGTFIELLTALKNKN